MYKELVSEFLNFLSNVKNYSSNTVVSYSNDVNQFLIFLDPYKIEQISQISHTHIRSWMVELMQSGISAKSINRKVSSLRSFFNYLKRNAIVEKNPMQKVAAPKIPKRLPRYVDEKKMKEVLDDKHVEDSYSSSREHIVISLLYHTGIRRAELLGLTLSDVNLSEMQLKVLGKGNKERIVPLNEQIVKELARYIRLRNVHFGKSEPALILTDKGKAAYPKLIYNIVVKVLSKYNASEKSSPHVLRHTFATHLTANGAELNAIKELLGHASLAATQVYTHNSIDRLKEVYDKSHPKSKKVD